MGGEIFKVARPCWNIKSTKAVVGTGMSQGSHVAVGFGFGFCCCWCTTVELLCRYHYTVSTPHLHIWASSNGAESSKFVNKKPMSLTPPYNFFY